MKKLLLLALFTASAAQAAIAPPCDAASHASTFAGQTTCSFQPTLAVAAPPPPPVPEPGTWALLGAGLVAICLKKWRK